MSFRLQPRSERTRIKLAPAGDDGLHGRAVPAAQRGPPRGGDPTAATLQSPRGLQVGAVLVSSVEGLGDAGG